MENKKINNNGHYYVDLGLPSGTLWATCNVGAKRPSDFGLYFQWGDTKGYTKEQIGKDEGQKKFDLDDYKWGKYLNFTKYTLPSDRLELVDDAANVNMGGDWHIPTPEQIQELLDCTTNKWMKCNGRNGRMFTSKKDRSKFIFIPAAGIVLSGSIYDSGNFASIWASRLNYLSHESGQQLHFDSETIDVGWYFRFEGLSIRGVIG